MDDLLATLRGMIPPELIDGYPVGDAATLVNLEIAYTPVIDAPVGDDYRHIIPKPVEVQKWSGGRWAVMYFDRKDFRRVTEDELKEMRARYLLLRGFYCRNFRLLPHSDQQRVLAWYFPDGLWLPAEGSDLAKVMGVH